MARAKSIGSLYAELSVRDKLTVGLKRARKQLNDFGGKAFTASTTAAAAAGTAIAAAMTAGTKRALDLGGRLSDVSAQTGLAVADVMKLERAFTDGGLSVESMVSSVARMQRAISDVATGRSTTNPFEVLGLSAQELMAMRPAEQFKLIGDRIKAIENPTRRNAAAMEIFGKSGAKLATVFGQFDTAAEALGRMPELAGRFADSFDRASDIIGGLPQKSDQFFVGFTSGIIGQILPGLEDINKKDFTTLGENLGNSISTALESLKSGDVWEIFKLQGEKALATFQTSPAMNNFAAFLNTLFDGITDTGQGFDFDKAFEKYKTAGTTANVELIDSLDAQIQEIIRRNADRAAAGRAKFDKGDAASPQSGLAPAAPLDFSKIVSNELTRPGGTILDSLNAIVEFAANIGPAEKADFTPQAYDANELQRRGLGYGGETLAREANKQVSLLKQIYDVLRKASTDGKLVWD